jgi:predicted kinase
VLIVLSGLPGTGKSVLADGIGRFFGFPVVSVDPVESAMLRSGVGPDQPTGLAAYLVAEALADRWLGLGLSPIVDAVNGVSEAKEMWRTLAIRHDVPLRVIECICSDPVLHGERLADRDRGLAFPEPTWDTVQLRRREWVPWEQVDLRVVDAAGDLDMNMRTVIGWLSER